MVAHFQLPPRHQHEHQLMMSQQEFLVPDPVPENFNQSEVLKNQPCQRSLLHQTEPISIDGGRLFIFPTKQCMLALLVNLRKHQFKLQNNAKVLAFAAVGVRPEPKGWPGKATLRPVIMIHYQVKQWEDRSSNEWHKYR